MPISNFESKQANRLDIVVSELLDKSRNYASNLIKQSKVTLDGMITTKCGANVKIGSKLTIDIPEPIESAFIAQDIPLNIVYQDDDVVVINKQQGLTVHPSGKINTNTLVNALLFNIKDLSTINGVIRAGIVHRLDKDTSGLMIVCKNDKSHNSIAKQISTKECRRVYTALVEGVVKADEGTIDQPIKRSNSDRKKMAIDSSGRKAVTHFKVLKRYLNYTLVEFVLETGRTHQIRVHSKFMLHPIVGDKIYGFIKQKFKLEGQLLHSTIISFKHPSTNEILTFKSDLPDYFLNCLSKLS